MGDTHDAGMWNAGLDMTTSSDPEVRDAGFKALELAENNSDGTSPGSDKPQGSRAQS
ncbi:hypothetical protein GWI34_25270 [Actinomadura sp. DSM 109109]|nr:hypothetical protein [Actinomadura lepetitiana]